MIDREKFLQQRNGVVTIIVLLFAIAFGFYGLGAALSFVGLISYLNYQILTVLGISCSFLGLMVVYLFSIKLHPFRRTVHHQDLLAFLFDHPLYAVMLGARAVMGFFMLINPLSFLIIVLILDGVDGLFSGDYHKFERHALDKIVDMINAIPLLLIVLVHGQFLIIWLALFAWRCFGQIYYHDTYSKAAFIVAPNLFTHLASMFVVVTAILPQFTFIFEGFFFFTTMYFTLLISTFFELTWHLLLSKIRYAPQELDLLTARRAEEKKMSGSQRKYFSALGNFLVLSISFVVSTVVYYFVPTSTVKIFQLVDVTAVIMFILASCVSLVLSYFIFQKSTQLTGGTSP
ncbi:MAG: hypothetical protein ACTSVI_14210 [Promethearchaeota archaeon]